MNITSKCSEKFHSHTQTVMQFTVVSPRELYFLKLSLLGFE